MITIVMLFVGAILGAHIVDDVVYNEKAKKIAMSVILVVGLLSAGLMVKSFIVPDAEQVAVINADSYDDQKGLFQENETGKYFVNLVNPWNPFKATYREYVDAKVAKEYVTKYNELKEIDIAGK